MEEDWVDREEEVGAEWAEVLEDQGAGALLVDSEAGVRMGRNIWEGILGSSRWEEGDNNHKSHIGHRSNSESSRHRQRSAAC